MARIASPRGSSSRHACAHKSNQTSIKPQLQSANTTTLSSPPLLLCLDCSYKRTSGMLLGLRPTRALVAPFFKCTGKNWRERVRTPDLSQALCRMMTHQSSTLSYLSVRPSADLSVSVSLSRARTRTRALSLSLCVCAQH